MQTLSKTKNLLSNLNVQTLEDEILLIREAEENYNPNKCISAKKAYIKGLEFINNLKI
jgi:hypothetical protein